jgi:RsiW-degrading membrane proteinase PrsW (M82 family)
MSRGSRNKIILVCVTLFPWLMCLTAPNRPEDWVFYVLTGWSVVVLVALLGKPKESASDRSGGA